MNISDITAVDVGVCLSRTATYILSAIFAYSFVSGLDYIVISLALIVITIAEIARVESFKALLNRSATLADVFIFVVTLSVSIVTLLGVISSVTLSDTRASEISDTKRVMLSDNIQLTKQQINQLNNEIIIYTERLKIKAEVNQRKEQVKQLKAQLEHYQNELLSLMKNSENVQATESVSTTLASSIGVTTSTVKNWLAIVSAISIDLFVLFFLYRQYVQNQAKKKPHYEQLVIDQTDNTDFSETNQVSVTECESDTSCNSSISELSDQNVDTRSYRQLDIYVTQAITLIENGTVQKGFRTNLRKALQVADQTAKEVCEKLVERSVLEKSGRFYRLVK